MKKVEEVARAMKQRFDISFFADHTTIEPHFCRDWDDKGGCYGTRDDHGYSFEDACDQVAQWYEQQAALWRSRQHHDCLYYIEQERAMLDHIIKEAGE